MKSQTPGNLVVRCGDAMGNAMFDPTPGNTAEAATAGLIAAFKTTLDLEYHQSTMTLGVAGQKRTAIRVEGMSTRLGLDRPYLAYALVLAENGGFRGLSCMVRATAPDAQGQCVRVFERVIEEPLEDSRQLPKKDALATLEGRALVVPKGCSLDGATIDCPDGMLTATIQKAPLIISTTTQTEMFEKRLAAHGKTQRRTVGCRVGSIRTTCGLVLLDSGEKWKTSVLVAVQPVEGGALDAHCTASSDLTKSIPSPCDQVFSLAK